MNKRERQFIDIVWQQYTRAGRHDLPWRKTANPYRIAVSESMLQQTQVSRVVNKYKEFLKLFPSVESLAQASLADVLKAWSGLGYNRRAKFLHKMAQVVVEEYNGIFPRTIEGLQELPGIGPYTAGALYAFAYNKPQAIIETNIRTVYMYHFFKNKDTVSDVELLSIIKKTLDLSNPREWYWALMDYGTHLKRAGIKNNSQSKQYTKQTKFEGSKRQLRGAITRELLKSPKLLTALTDAIGKEKAVIQIVLNDLLKEEFIVKNKGYYEIV